MTKVILQKQEEVCNNLLDNLHRKFKSNITHLILFGSRAKGTAKPWSDYDFIVILNSKTKRIIDEIYDIVTDFLLKYGVDISLKIYEEKDFEDKKNKKNPFINRIINTGIELWK